MAIEFCKVVYFHKSFGKMGSIKLAYVVQLAMVWHIGLIDYVVK